MIEALVVAAAVLALVGITWLPTGAARLLGASLLAIALWLGLRHAIGDGPAGAVAVPAAAAAARFLPGRVLRRVAFVIPSLVVLVLATTWLMYLAPGNPFAQERALSPQVESALREAYGVPEGPLEFFVVYADRLLRDGSLGPSLSVQGRTVGELLAPALPVSLSLGLFSLVLAVGVGLALGVQAGLRAGSAADHVSMALAVVGLSLPNFVIGAALMILLSLWLGWLPVAGWGSFGHLVMPAITLALPTAATVARLARGGTVEAMTQEYVVTARAKGLPERVVVMRHALPGALLPVVSYLGPAAAAILTGSFVVETLFGIPGMGQWFVKGAINRDYSLVIGTAVFYFSLVSVFNLLVDLAYAWLDPRVRDSA